MGTTNVVEQMHHTIAGASVFAAPVRQISRLVYAGVRGVTRVVGLTVDQALLQLAPLLGDAEPGPEVLAATAALNGVIGDLLERTGNALAQPLELHPRGATSPRVVVLVHGSSMNDLQWLRQGHDHGAALERDLGLSPVYVRYNSGLHVSTNGQRLAAELERLDEGWPVPLEELVLVGFSMGGLVARSACHAAEVAGLGWRRKLTSLVCLGTPHHGSPLERAGSWADAALEVSRYSAPIALLGKVRSEGVTDLRFGFVLDSHWRGRERFELGVDERAPLPLPAGVRCFAIAATQSSVSGPRLRSDGLVPVDSALGVHRAPHLHLQFPSEHQQVVYAARHLDLLSSPVAYATLKEWLSAFSARPP
ncbi:MAG: alpha/beta hydrolase [Myxococcaceae bacterium]|nr:alpha/beta hydrolase [Myxococcaceae bacterium]